jgi:hypothetical protein
MALTNQDIIFASLMGSNAVATYQRTQLVQNELSKRVLPNIPFLPLQQNDNSVKAGEDLSNSDYKFGNTVISGERKNTFRINLADAETTEAQQFFPLSFSFTEKGQKWLFPYEPMINISSGNNIVKRNVAKQGDKLVGTIKERWSRKDFDIQVTGALIGSLISGSVDDCFPKKQMIELFEYLKYNKEIYVFNPMLVELGIIKVVVEDYSFPFTKGENVQAYDIKLVSDYSYDLFIKEEF